MDSKHELCKHKESCLVNASKGFFRGAVIGLVFRTALTVLGLAIKGRIFKKPQEILKIFRKDNMRIVLFLSLMVGLYRSALCAMRRLTNDERISAFVAGFCSGIPLAFENPESRVTYSTYFIVRGLDALCKWGVSSHIIPSVSYSYQILLIIACSIMHYTKAANPECLSKGYMNFLNTVVFHPNDNYLTDFVTEPPIRIK